MSELEKTKQTTVNVYEESRMQLKLISTLLKETYPDIMARLIGEEYKRVKHLQDNVGKTENDQS